MSAQKFHNRVSRIWQELKRNREWLYNRPETIACVSDKVGTICWVWYWYIIYEHECEIFICNQNELNQSPNYYTVYLKKKPEVSYIRNIGLKGIQQRERHTTISETFIYKRFFWRHKWLFIYREASYRESSFTDTDFHILFQWTGPSDQLQWR